MSKKKVLPIKPPVRIGFLAFLGDQGGCGVLRTIIPYLLLNHLRIKGVSIHTQYFSQWIGDFNFYKNYSFIQFQRSATEQHLKIHRLFRKKIKPNHRIPLVYEIDDDILNIPEWNFAHHYYKENIQHIEVMLRESDAIVVSTKPLKNLYSKYNKNIKVQQNHLPRFIWGNIKPRHKKFREGDKVRILWAGSQNHFKLSFMKSAPDGGDFDSILMDFIRKTVNEYQWVFMGAMPMELDDVKDKVEFHNWQNTFDYPQYLKSLKCDIGIAPLEKNVFNSGKSNIKALEFTALGIPGIYSDVSPYNNLSVKCKTQEEMVSKIEEMAKDIELRGDVWEKDYNILKGDLWWETENNLRKYVDLYLGLMNVRLP